MSSNNFVFKQQGTTISDQEIDVRVAPVVDGPMKNTVVFDYKAYGDQNGKAYSNIAAEDAVTLGEALVAAGNAVIDARPKPPKFKVSTRHPLSKYGDQASRYIVELTRTGDDAEAVARARFSNLDKSRDNSVVILRVVPDDGGEAEYFLGLQADGSVSRILQADGSVSRIPEALA